MKRLAIALAALVLALGTAAAVAVYAFPASVIELTRRAGAARAGLEARELEVDGYAVHYLEGGEGEPLVLLHGMADEKNSFVAAAAELTGAHRVLLPDLGGHGENARDPSRDYGIAGQAALVDGFVDALGLESFALGGNSMGGHVSAAYALARPERVTHLVLVNAPGLVLDGHVVYAGLGDEIESREDFFAIMDRVVHERPPMPGPLVDHLIERANADREFLNAAARAVREGEGHDLRDRAGDIAVPTLILWGERDEVVPFAVAEDWDRLVPDSRLVVLPDAGHSPQLERGAEIGRLIGAFLAE